MERIKLTKQEKKVFKALDQYGDECNPDCPEYEFEYIICSLQQKGLVKGAFVEGGRVEAVRITNKGKSYLRNNPELKNPVDWAIVTSVAVASAVLATAVLFMTCSINLG